MKLQDYLAEEEITQTEFARAVGVTQGMVWQWLNGVRRVSAEQVLVIERATKKRVSRHDLRPDLYPRESAA